MSVRGSRVGWVKPTSRSLIHRKNSHVEYERLRWKHDYKGLKRGMLHCLRRVKLCSRAFVLSTNLGNFFCFIVGEVYFVCTKRELKPRMLLHAARLLHVARVLFFFFFDSSSRGRALLVCTLL